MIHLIKPAPCSAEQLREILHYDPETGAFTWRVRRGPTTPAGSTAGVINGMGYRRIRIGEPGTFAGGRLAWLYMTGEWPTELIDHINGNRSDDRWSNLRHASIAQNSTNTRRKHPLPRGVSLSKCGKRFRARLDRSKGFPKVKDLGTFDTPEEAHGTWLAAARERYGEFIQHI
jgi:hypothetical protein